MKAYWRKLPNGSLAPEDDAAREFVARVKIGDVVGGEFTRPRNYAFHKKWFSLLSYAFDTWEPAQGSPEKNFDRFRKEITMLAGYAHEVPSLRGGTRWEADSISFGAMDEDTFSELYEKTLAVLMKWVLKNYTRQDVDRVLANIAEYA